MSNKKIFFLFCLVLAQWMSVKAQYLSLQQSEIKKLRMLIESDKSAYQLYAELLTIANASLQSEPNPIDTIVSEGHLSTDPKKIRTQKSLADMKKIYALALVYSVSQNPVYKEKCADYFMAWAGVNHGTGNPINDTKLDPVMEAYDLLKDEMPAATRILMSGWFTQIAEAEINNPRFKTDRPSASNNWNSHRIKVIGNIAYVLNNRTYQDFTDTALKKQIQKNLFPDGSGMDLLERDALHYHVYTLEPLLKIAMVIQRAGGSDFFNYVSPEGSSIQKSVAFLIPFVNGRMVHPEYVNSKVAFDKKRAENHEPGFIIGAPFKPEAAIDVFSYATYFNRSYIEIVRKLMNSDATYSNWQLLLNEITRK